MKIVLQTLIALFLVHSAIAGCLDDIAVFLSQKTATMHITVAEGENVDSASLNEIKKTFSQLEKFFTHLTTPQTLNLYVAFAEGGFESFMKQADDVIWLTPKLIYSNLKEEKKTLETLYAHEYGHILFKENFHRFSDLDDLRRETRIYEISTKILNIKADGKEIEQAALLQQLIAEKVRLNTPAYKKMKITIPSYNELFADIVAVVIQKDPQAITKAINKRARDFIDPEIKLDAKDIYSELNHARAYIGKLLKNKDVYQDDHFLERILKVLIQSVEEEMNTPAQNLIEKNSRLIKNLKKEFIQKRIISMNKTIPLKAYTPAPFTVSSSFHTDEQHLFVTFKVSGNLDEISIREISNPLRKYDLWEETVFELFLKAENDKDYIEFNFSPSSEWNSFQMTDYRVNIGENMNIKSTPIEVTKSDNELTLVASIDLSQLTKYQKYFAHKNEQGLLVGITSILRLKNGEKIHYSSAPNIGAPDFHHPSTFSPLK